MANKLIVKFIIHWYIKTKHKPIYSNFLSCFAMYTYVHTEFHVWLHVNTMKEKLTNDVKHWLKHCNNNDCVEHYILLIQIMWFCPQSVRKADLNVDQVLVTNKGDLYYKASGHNGNKRRKEKYREVITGTQTLTRGASQILLFVLYLGYKGFDLYLQEKQ